MYSILRVQAGIFLFIFYIIKNSHSGKRDAFYSFFSENMNRGFPIIVVRTKLSCVLIYLALNYLSTSQWLELVSDMSHE